jgi:hypothetical protein
MEVSDDVLIRRKLAERQELASAAEIAAIRAEDCGSPHRQRRRLVPEDRLCTIPKGQARWQGLATGYELLRKGQRGGLATALGAAQAGGGCFHRPSPQAKR